MTTRTTKATMTFHNPFFLNEVDEKLPAGDYVVTTDEEVIEGLSWMAYRRVATFISLPATSSRQLVTRLVKIDPTELEEALKIDSA